MQDVFKLFLARILYVFLLIIATEANGGFPMTPKHNSLVSLFTVGIPTLALVAWANPGKVHGAEVSRKIFHFILSPGLTLGVAGLGVFVGTYLFPAMRAGNFSLGNGIEYDPTGLVLSMAQSALTTFFVLCGLLLVLFVKPPSRLFLGGNDFSGDRPPGYLALALLLTYAGILTIPVLSKFFELTPLIGWNYLILIGLAGLWALFVRWTWRNNILGQYLGLENK
jgi:cation-transporting ATPase E